jgi:ABC-type transport system involved in cytochrome c biogenesis permease subunit
LVKRSYALFGLTTAMGAAAALSAAGAQRLGAMAGVAAAAVTSAVALGLLFLAMPGGLKRVLGALAVAFFLRMITVAAGLLAARSAGGDLLAFCIAFFALYLAHQVIEIAAASRRSGARPAEGKA